MGRIMAFTVSGRANSVSTRLVHLAGDAASAGGHTVQYVDLAHSSLQCCTGCGYCRTHERCTINDSFFRDIVASDGIIVGFPIYFSGIAGQGKVWLDRLYPMMEADFVPRHPGKKILAIYAQGDGNEKAFTAAINATNYVFRMCGWKLVDSVLCAGTSTPGFEIPEATLERTKKAGERL